METNLNEILGKSKKLDNSQTTFCSEKCKKTHYLNTITKNDILSIFYDIKGVSYEKAAQALNISTNCFKNKCKKFGIMDEIKKIRFGT